MTEPNRENFVFLIGLAIVATVVLVIVSALYFGSQNGAQRNQQFKLACLEAGGSYVSGGSGGQCINPTTPVAQ